MNRFRIALWKCLLTSYEQMIVLKDIIIMKSFMAPAYRINTTLSIVWGGWQSSAPFRHDLGFYQLDFQIFSVIKILSIFCKAIYFPWRNDWMTPSDNSASFLNLLVLYPASFNASRMFILYRIKVSPPLLLDALFHYPHYSIGLHRNQCKK